MARQKMVMARRVFPYDLPSLRSKKRISAVVAAQLPAELKRGLKRAVKKTGFNESDIVRSLLYNFCLSIDAIKPMPQLEETDVLNNVE